MTGWLRRDFIRPLLYGSLVLFGVSWVLSWPLALQFGQILDRYAGGSVFPERLAGGWDWLFATDFLIHTSSDFGALGLGGLALTMVFICLQPFLNAGAASLFAVGPAGLGRRFGLGVLRHGGRFLLLAVVFLPLHALTLAPAAGLLALAGASVDQPGTVPTILAWTGLALVAGLAGLTFSQTCQLLAKAELVARRSTFRAALLAPWKLRGRPLLASWGRCLAILLAGSAVLAAVAAIPRPLHPWPSLLALALQVSVFLHIGLRVLLHGVFVRRFCRVPVVTETPGSPESLAALNAQLRFAREITTEHTENTENTERISIAEQAGQDRGQRE